MNNLKQAEGLPPGNRARRQYVPFLAVLFILLASLTVYSTALFNGFVYDDTAQVVGNPWIRDVASLPTIFTSGVWGFAPGRYPASNYYRPLMHVVYLINYHLFGLRPWGFHLVNMLFHTANSVLVFLLVTSLQANKLASEQANRLSSVQAVKLTSLQAGRPVSEQAGKPASLQAGKPASGQAGKLVSSAPFIAALLFAAHPVHTEAVAWVSALPDLGCAFFYLLSFYFYIMSREAGLKAYIMSLLSFFAALLFKEPALTLPVILIAYDLCTHPSIQDSRFAIRTLRSYLPYLIIAAMYLLLRENALRGLAPAEAYKGVSTYEYIINVFPLCVDYLTQLLFPVNLNFWHAFHPITSLASREGISSLTVTTGFAVLIYLAWKRDKLLFLGLLFIIVPLFPAFYLKGISSKPYAERYLYLPSFGFVLICGRALASSAWKFRRGALVAVTALVLAFALYAAATISRNRVWKDDLSLFSDTVVKSPGVEGVRGELGNALLDAGRYNEAIEQFRLITEKLNPNSVQAYKSLGLAFLRKGDPKQAAEEYRRALTLAPDDRGGHQGLAMAYEQSGLTDGAIEQYRILLVFSPDDPALHNKLGIALAGKGELVKATGEFETAVRLAPGEQAFRRNLEKVRGMLRPGGPAADPERGK